ncbi:MAG: NrsF family protein [Acidobacteriota bacterium]
MSETPKLPERLREAVAVDLRPVRPLASPWRRVLWVAPVVALILVFAIAHFGVRPDLNHLSPWLSWLPVGVQLMMGLALLALALQEAVPGMGISRTVVVCFCLLALGLHVGVNLLIWLSYPMGTANFLQSWWNCFHYEVLLGIPLLVVITVLAASALPVRPRTVGLLSGAGAGIMSDASWRMICPITTPYHVLLAHGGGILLLAGTGYLLGWLWERNRAGGISEGSVCPR